MASSAEAGRRQPRRNPNSAATSQRPPYLGYVLSRTGKPAEAQAEYRKGLALDQKLADDNPAVTNFRRNLASSTITWLVIC